MSQRGLQQIYIFLIAWLLCSSVLAMETRGQPIEVNDLTYPDYSKITKGEFHARYNMAKSSSPRWSLDAFLKLPELWCKDSDKEPSCKKIRPFSNKYYEEFARRYGLFPRTKKDFLEPMTNLQNLLPVGLVLTEVNAKTIGEAHYISGHKGVTVSCESCHASRLFDQNTYGVGNVFFNFEALSQDLSSVDDKPNVDIFEMNPHRNSMVNSGFRATNLGTHLRVPGLALHAVRSVMLMSGALSKEVQFIINNPAYLKTPSLITFGTKRTHSSKASVDPGFGFFYDGSAHKDNVFADQLLVHGFLTLEDTAYNTKLQQLRIDWVTDGKAYIEKLPTPEYPFKIDFDLALKGYSQIYQQECAACHGSYKLTPVNEGEPLNQGFQPTLVNYPLYKAHLKEIGTDPTRAQLTGEYTEEFNRKHQITPGDNQVLMKVTNSYVAPPLNGIWARAPYLHNASVPNVMTLLTYEKERPCHYGIIGLPNDKTSYDQENMGWRVDTFTKEEFKDDTPSNYVRFYSCGERGGMTNTGHNFGAHLGLDDKKALIEFLKTL